MLGRTGGRRVCHGCGVLRLGSDPCSGSQRWRDLQYGTARLVSEQPHTRVDHVPPQFQWSSRALGQGRRERRMKPLAWKFGSTAAHPNRHTGARSCRPGPAMCRRGSRSFAFAPRSSLLTHQLLDLLSDQLIVPKPPRPANATADPSEGGAAVPGTRCTGAASRGRRLS